MLYQNVTKNTKEDYL